MARRREAEPVRPVYVQGMRTTVPLAYPFRLGARRVARVSLVPPTLGDLEVIRASEIVNAAILLSIMSGETEDVIRACRWPDVDVLLRAALDLLPPDIAALVSDDGAAPAVHVSEPALQPEPILDDPGGPEAFRDFMIDPAEMSLDG